MASNDNATGTKCSSLALTATKGVTYQIMVNGRTSGVGGNIVLNLNRLSAPEISVQQPVGSELDDGLTKKSFGTVKVGSKGTAKSFTIRNAGTAALTGLALSRSGTNSAEFILGTLKTTSLAAGASTTFTVTFAPKTKGTRVATIQIKSNDADENPFDIPVTGMAAAR